MEKWIYWLIIVGLIVLSIFSIRGCVKAKNAPEPGITIIETRDTVVNWDTIKIVEPKLITEKVVDYIYIYLWDTVEVVLPKTQKFYADSNYKAWVSGYEPNLDSLEVYEKETLITHLIQKTIVTQPKRFGWCFYAGVGGQYGVIQRKFDFGPQIGVGFYVRLEKKKEPKISIEELPNEK